MTTDDYPTVGSAGELGSRVRGATHTSGHGSSSAAAVVDAPRRRPDRHVEDEPAGGRAPLTGGGSGGRLRRAAAVLQAKRAGVWPAATDEPGSDRPTLPAYLLFVATFVFYGCYSLLTHSPTIIGGSMWAEMGTNYYASTALPWYQQLFATDSGYIPLPQRLLVLLGQGIGISPAAIPYFYTGTALLLSAAIVGSVCLPVFRTVIASDALRFLLAIALLLVPDFETRTFINFTYFAVVAAGLLTTLALVGDREVPVWAWALPVLTLSKPGVLAALPAMIIAAVVSRRRFRRVTAVSVLAGAVQAVQLVISAHSGTTPLQSSHDGALTKVLSAGEYSLGFLGRVVLEPGNVLGTEQPFNIHRWIVVGVVVTLASLAAVPFLRSRATALSLVGLSFVAFTMLLDCFTFGQVFTPGMDMLKVAGFDRRYVVAVVGGLLVVGGLVAAVAESPRVHRLAGAIGPAVSRRIPRAAAIAAPAAFALWFLFSGWLQYASAMNQPLGLPAVGASQWEARAAAVATGERVCVPLDPFGWMYGRDCQVFTGTIPAPLAFGWAAAPSTDDPTWSVTIDAPASVRDGSLASLAILAQDPAGATEVSATAVLTRWDGSTTRMSAQGRLPAYGGALQFVQSPTPLLSDVRSVTLTVPRNVRIASANPEDARKAIVMWMGQPRP